MPSFLDTLDQINQGLQGWSNTPQGMSQILSMRGIDTASQADIIGQQQAVQEAQYKQEEQQRIARARELMATIEPNDAAKLRELMALDPTAAANFLKMYERQAPSSTLGKTLADVDAGIIPAEYKDAIIKKATTIAPVYDPATGYWTYPSGTGGSDMGGVTSIGGGAPYDAVGEGLGDIPPGMNPLEAKAFRERRASLAAEREGEVSKKEVKAKDMLGIIEKARAALSKSSSGLFETGIREAGQAVGISTDASKADRELAVYAGALTSNVPRMEGPQGVLDVELYKQMAGDIANTMLPKEDRLALVFFNQCCRSKRRASGH